MTARKLFVFGLGYTAGFLADSLRAEGWSVAGTVQSPQRCAALQAAGIDAHLFDRDHRVPDDVLVDATHLLLSIPPDAKGDPVLARYGETLAQSRALEWAGYLSSTGVYGDTEGAWVSEAAWLKPLTERARRRVDAEKGWLDLRRRLFFPVHVFRLSGIYGPGRSALDDVRAGTARRIDKPGHVFCRIHVADIVSTLRASMALPNPGGIYNVADDLPAPAQEVVAYAAELLGVEPPPLVPVAEAGLSAMSASFYGECRRVKNERIKSKLGVVLAYPSYKAGLAALRAAEAV